MMEVLRHEVDMIKLNNEIENIIAKLQINKIPRHILRSFIYSLFENGTIQIGKYKIVSWNNNDRHLENKIWTKENKEQFERYGLLTKIETDNDDVFHEINHNDGASVWRLIAKEINAINNETQLNQDNKQKEVISRRFQHVHINELINRRDKLENERCKLMSSVSKSQIKNRGHYTSVKVKEGYAERLISIINDIELEIEYRAVS